MSWEVDEILTDKDENSGSYGGSIAQPCDALCTVYRDGVAIAEVSASKDHERTYFTDYDVVPGSNYVYWVSAFGKTTWPATNVCLFVGRADIGAEEISFGAEGGSERVSVLIQKVTALTTSFAYWDNPICSVDWLSAEIGDSWRSVVISATSNKTEVAREGVVTIPCLGYEWQIRVKQVANEKKYTVTFDLNGASGIAPAERTVREGDELGELPEVTAPAGWTLLGWYTAATDGTKTTASTKVTADTTLYAHWSKCDIGFYVPTMEGRKWDSAFFVTTASKGISPMTTFTEGERIYLKYAYRNLAGAYKMRGFINRFTLNTPTSFDDSKYSNNELSGSSWEWGGSAWSPDELQNLAPGTYTLTCTLDATGVLAETDEDNNTQSITFTVVAKDAPPPTDYTVTFNANGGSVSSATRTVTSGAAVGTLPDATRSGYTFDGWFTSANGGTEITSSTKVTANVIYYAHWTQVVTPHYTVVFDLNGASGTAPDARTVYEGKTVGELPEVAVPTGWTFLGWYTAATDGTKVTASTKVTADTTLYAHWSKCDIGFYVPTVEGRKWDSAFFVTTASKGISPMTTFTEGERIYLKYAYRNLAGEYGMRGFINRFTLNTPTSFDDSKYSNNELSGTSWEWGGSAWYPDELQNLAPGTYTLTCTLDATEALAETDEDNNTQSITFTVVAKDAPTPTNYTVTFNANGGSVSPATRTVASGAEVGTLPDATRSGYTFDGWFTSANGGTKITSSTKVTANVTYYAHWTQVVMPPPGPIPPKPGDPIQVTIIVIINNLTIDTINLTVIYGNVWGTNLPVAPARLGWTFVGWFTGENGTGTRVTATTVVSEATQKLYAYYVKDEVEPVVSYYLYDSVVGVVPQTVASVYDGYLYNKSTGALAGTIQVKVGKPNAKTHLASVKATVIGLDGKKKSLKAVEKGKALIQTNSPTTVQLVGGDACEVTLGSKGMVGEYGNYFIDGALNVFTSKDAADKATAAAVLGKWQGVVNVAWQNAGAARSVIAPYQTLSVTIANKGKAKVAGTLADGTKVSASSQLLVGDEWCCVPVLEPKKSHLAFVLWLPKDATGRVPPVVAGLADAIVGKPGTLKVGAEFRMDEVLGDAKYAKYLPDGLAVTQNGTKWVVAGGAKAGKVQLAKDGSGSVDETKTGDNPSALKLTYTAKTGAFKGSFKAYSDVNGKPKGVTVNVTGVLVDGVGYGTATIKKVVSAPVMILLP